MISFIRKLVSPPNNIQDTAWAYARILSLPVTRGSLRSAIDEHPDYPSMLALHDALASFGVEVLAVRISQDQLAAADEPFIAQIQVPGTNEPLFTVVRPQATANLAYLHPIRQAWIPATADQFAMLFTGIALFAETSKRSGEPDYEKKRREEQRGISQRRVAAAGILAMILILAIYSFGTLGIAAWLPLSLLAASLAGTGLGVLLLWYEVDRHNPALREVCSGGGGKANCDAILHSGASGIWGISWSLVGFSYFSGVSLTLLMGGLQNPALWGLLGWISVISIAFTVFSVFYQWRIARQWCALCLAVQAVLIIQAVIAFAGGQLGLPPRIPFHEVFSLGIAFALSGLAARWLVTVRKQAGAGRKYQKELIRLKHNPQIFHALLAKQKAIATTTHGLGISLGNPNAKNHIIKVCNPYCGPCAKAHPAIEEILHSSPDVQAQIIFTATNDEHDRKAPPVRHLLAIAEKGNEQVTKQALDDWYMAKEKDYAAFAAKYPMNGELAQQTAKLEAMQHWCNTTEIAYTPTFFINGYQLPDLYSLDDLRYFLKT